MMFIFTQACASKSPSHTSTLPTPSHISHQSGSTLRATSFRPWYLLSSVLSRHNCPSDHLLHCCCLVAGDHKTRHLKMWIILIFIFACCSDILNGLNFVVLVRDFGFHTPSPGLTHAPLFYFFHLLSVKQKTQLSPAGRRCSISPLFPPEMELTVSTLDLERKNGHKYLLPRET